MKIGEQLHRKERFKRFLKDRFFLRFHMSLILTGTFLSGLVVSSALLHLHVDSMLIRYPIAVICSYLAFFGFVRLWLLYMKSSGRNRKATERSFDGLDLVDIIPDSIPTGRLSIPRNVPFSGGSGQFQGAGASGIFDQGATSGISDALVSTSSESAGSGAAGAAGEAASGILEDSGIILVILGALLAIVFGAGIYLIYEAPAILSEAAFDFLIATSLLRSLKRMDNPDWAGGVFRTTVFPFAIVLLIAASIAGISHSVYPGARKLSEVIGFLLSL